MSHIYLAATLVRLGEREEARAVASGIMRDSPGITRWQTLWPYRNPHDAEHMNEAVHEAGFL